MCVRLTLRCFGAMHTALAACVQEVHHDPELADRRRFGAVGSHRLDAVAFPLRFTAKPHDQVSFKPLKYGWMAEKGEMTATEFIADCSNDTTMRRHAQSLASLPLCPHLCDANGVVMSVTPLSNGWESRSTPDQTCATFLECSSATSDAHCSRILMVGGVT